jgi:hypothetical protein
MTQSKIREELHKTIDRMDAAKLRQLHLVVAGLMKLPPTPEKRIGGKYKGQFKIKEGFDELPDDFMAAFTKS